MALVANPLPIDTMTVGKRVAYFDPTADMAGLKKGKIVAVARGVSGTNEVMTLTVLPDGAEPEDTISGAARFFRVIDDMEGAVNV